jgi:hypothetical protein
VSVRFLRPVLLPSSVTFGEAEGVFAVHGHLAGETRGFADLQNP